MSNDRVNRTVFIETSRSQSDIRNTFSQCGKIYGIYPWASQAGHTGFKYFLEFREQGSVKRARALQLPDIKVHVVAFSPPLTAQFGTIVPPPSAPPSPMEIKVEARDPEHVSSHIAWRQTADPRPAKRARPSSSMEGYDPSSWSTRQRPRSSIEPADIDFACNSLYRKQTDGAATERPDSNKENDVAIPMPHQMSPVQTQRQVQHRPEANFRDPSSPSVSRSYARIPIPTAVGPVANHFHKRNGAPTQEFPHSDHSSATPPASLCIILSYRGTPITCNLETLEELPDGIIEVLKETAARSIERDKWMIVGGHYRSKGNVKAAAAVMSAMIEVMTSPAVGLPAQDLKPAFLMLSSCHTDLAKQTRAPDGSCTDESSRHILEAAKWLQQVYGMHVPPSADPAYDECAAVKASMDVSTISPAPAHVPSPARGYLANTSNLPAPTPAHEQRESAGPSRGQVQILEREIQALRDRQADHGALLSEARALRRRLQEELDEERRARRKAERALEQATLDVAGARRAQKQALDQARAEGEGRRRAEDRASELRDEVVRVRRECQVRVDACAEEDRRARECFGKLGVLFLQASKGEIDGGVWKDALGRERGVSTGESVDMRE